jgi:5-methylcytosine-specific restriction endonuclease McrA
MMFFNRKSDSWVEWRRKVYARDRWTCRMCGAHGKNVKLAPHHIYPKSWKPQWAFMVWNGITLCWGCHDSILGEEKRWIDYFRIKLKEFSSWVQHGKAH